MGRIDVHHHAILPEIARLMERAGAPFVIPWSEEVAVRVMADNDVDYAFISNAVPGSFFDDGRQSADFHRAVNDVVAEYVSERRDRLGLITAVPMPHVDEALEEVAYSFDKLGADGVLLVPHCGEEYLGDPLFEPLLQELNRRAAVVLVHPMPLYGSSLPQLPAVLADFLLDTTRGALNLILSGALDRYPDIQFVLSHGGGFLPYAATRADLLATAFMGEEAGLVARNLRRFWYDTALTGASALPSLFSTVGPERVLFGTDWCAAPESAVRTVVGALEAHLEGADREMVDRGNALRLFPHLAQRNAAQTTCLRDASIAKLAA